MSRTGLHLATVGADGKPHVVPVWPARDDDMVWIFSHTNSVKVRNLASTPNDAGVERALHPLWVWAREPPAGGADDATVAVSSGVVAGRVTTKSCQRMSICSWIG